MILCGCAVTSSLRVERFASATVYVGADFGLVGNIHSPLTTNMNNETISISRATSVSRASRHGSTHSRSQSLIKKNIAPHDLRPSDILIERFVAWKAIVKQLIAYFEVHSDSVVSFPSLTYFIGHRRHRD